jgi:predicted MFS family arabinose efflux permease
VPPTVALTVEAVGRERAGLVFGWIFAAHQLGAAVAAWAASAVRKAAESHEIALFGAGLLGVTAAFLALAIASRGRPAAAAAMPK